jgi:hypothetical protein
MPTIYLEYEEEDAMMWGQLGEEEPRDEFIFNEDEEDEPKQNIEFKLFRPLYLYRSELEGSQPIEIDFEPLGFDKLHIVIVRYSKANEFENLSGLWHIENVYKTRREASKMAEFIRELPEEYNKEVPWKQDDTEIEEVQVETLGVED